MSNTGFWNVVRREVRRLASRPIYLVGMTLVPIFLAFFFVSLLGPGLPRKVPSAIVDLDHTSMSRQVTRSLNAMELVDICEDLNSYNEAIDAVQEGRIMGFFVIPENFQQDAVAGRGPTLTFYSNLTYYVPGTLVFKGFKTLAVTTSGAIVENSLVSKGAPESLANVVLQPMTIQNHPLHNPWLNYSYYLSTSFLAGVLELMIFIMTVYSITMEHKYGTSPQWLQAAGGRIGTALLGKLFPQFIIWVVIGFGMDSLMFGWHHFPMNGHLVNMLLATVLFVIASQSFAVIAVSVVPNARLALSMVCLTGILAFSIAAFSFPVQSMYGAISIFADILPVRWYFLIYIDQALNGIPLYYSRFYYIALLVFPIVATLFARRIKHSALHPVYVP